ncbi:hypothetical protein HK097_002708 [Rhizophlyctis rosea]|uniref:histidine kinase n=1 Tax=Rhizophlyctis rosea TaxID=64517 RepID=A0AAD5SK80_9FUNG|nr:hypothetical protein HK097_002708 [Rhizophlyctis rosea]
MSIIRDVTERKRLETDLHGLLDAAPDGIIVTNAEGFIVVVNSEIQKLFGYERFELLGRLIEILIPSRFHGKHTRDRQAYTENPSTRPMGPGMELAGRKKDGIELPVEISLSPLIRNGETHVIAVVRDITAQKALKTQIIEAREMAVAATSAKQTFLSNMSHEIRTPMKQTSLDSEQKGYVHSIGQCCDSLLSIVNDILDFSKIEAGRLRLDCRVADLNVLLKDIADLFSGMASKKRIAVELEKTIPTPMYVCADLGRLRQILSNLISNGIKFTEKGVVRLRFAIEMETPTQYTLAVRVKDTGIGIDENQRHHLFKVFSQLDASTTKQFSGTGLGLVITQNLIHLMGGQIDYTSEPGVGSTFWFTVTLDKAVAPIVVPKVVYPKLAGRILVVDDNDINLLIAKKMVISLGFLVSTAKNGLEAIKATDEGFFDLMFMDIHVSTDDQIR